MKKITFSLFLLLLVGQFTMNAQQKSKSSKKSPQKTSFQITDATKESINLTGYARCLTDENEIALQQENPKRYTTEQFENWIAPKIAQIKAERLAGRSSQAIYNIPVVIHVIHNGDAINTVGNVVGENISDEQALSQIQVMNEDFRRLTGTPGGANSTGLAVDVEINFCVALTDPDGNATTGVVRHNITPYSDNVANGSGGPDWETRADVQAMKATTQWDPTKYLNMWTIRPGGNSINAGGLNGLLGYAQFPDNTPNLGGLNNSGGVASTDGVVAAYNAMGTIAENDGSFILNNTYNLGRTMTHEVGHWVGLRHIWGDGPESGSCSVDDYCADTPNAAQPNFTCNLSNNSCTNNADFDQVQNYMDYTNDACMDTFTQNQKDRIQAIMSMSPRRMELNSSTTCQPAMVFDLDARVKINNLNSIACDFTITPVIEIINNGNNPITAITYSYGIDGNNTTVNWTGNLASFGDSDIISLPTLSSSSGAHTFNATISNPNGGTDMNTDNDDDSEDYTFGESYIGSTSIELELTTDLYGGETSWEFANSAGDVLYSGSGLANSTTYNESFIIDDNECYTFTIFDDYSDGICCDFGSGSYELRDNTGALIFEGGEFGASETTTISTASLSTSEYELSNSLSIYPNPTSNVLTIKATNNNVPDAYAVYNMLGQVVLSKKIVNDSDLTINTSELSNGMYFIKIAKEANQVSLPFIKK